jgi:hypothetical protein
VAGHGRRKDFRWLTQLLVVRTPLPPLKWRMDQHITTLERAFQLARSGSCHSVVDIKKALKSEGYATDQITGLTLARQLKALIDSAKDPDVAG